MKIVYDTDFLTKLKKLNVRIRKSFKRQILIFAKDPRDSRLDNHALRNAYAGYHSIDITADYRAIYEEIHDSNDEYAYFIAIGTYKELYGKT